MPEFPDSSSFLLSKLFECPFTWSYGIASPHFRPITYRRFAVTYKKIYRSLPSGGREVTEVAEKKKTLVFLATAVKLRGNLNTINMF